ncbi:MAG: hypothetical protein Q9204_007869 [Flavoplaca sp. TL-2023a]
MLGYQSRIAREQAANLEHIEYTLKDQSETLTSTPESRALSQSERQRFKGQKEELWSLEAYFSNMLHESIPKHDDVFPVHIEERKDVLAFLQKHAEMVNKSWPKEWMDRMDVEMSGSLCVGSGEKMEYMEHKKQVRQVIAQNMAGKPYLP